MKKILYVISTLSDTGPVNIIYETIKNIDRSLYEPQILTLSKELPDSRIEDFIKLGIKIHSLNLSRTKGYILGAYALRKILKTISPDIIHAHCFRSALLISSVSKLYKICATIHCDYTEDYPSTYGPITGKLMSFTYTIALKKIFNNYCVSEILANILKNKYKNISFNYVNNGIDINKFNLPKSKRELREKLNLPIDKILFIYVGTLSERKKPNMLIDAFKNNDIVQKNAYLILRGGGPLKSVCQEKIINQSNIKIVGKVDNLNEYYQASDYYISASTSEGLPGAVIEAMSCGLPVVLSDIEQHKYVLKDNSGGVVFKTGDKKDLINKIKNIMDYDYNHYSGKARENVEKYFSSEIMAKNYQKKYEGILI